MLWHSSQTNQVFKTSAMPINLNQHRLSIGVFNNRSFFTNMEYFIYSSETFQRFLNENVSLLRGLVTF